jgi:hypothetical protein
MKCEEVEVFLSGHLDGELTQQQEQWVAVHLDSCTRCPAILEDLRAAQKAARNLEIDQPRRKEWNIMESQILERTSRGVGWLILIVWAIVTAVFCIYQYATSPAEPLFEKVLTFGFFLGFALLFFSVLCQRLRESKTDRYRGVQK